MPLVWITVPQRQAVLQDFLNGFPRQDEATDIVSVEEDVTQCVGG